jgi:hypothetical protein
MIPKPGSAVWERRPAEADPAAGWRGGTVLELEEERCHVIEMWHGRLRYHWLPHQALDPESGDGKQSTFPPFSPCCAA